MSKFEYWILRKIFKRQVRQDADHIKKIIQLYVMMRKAIDEEFTEDNIPTLNDFTTRCFECSLK